nr:LEAFY [Ipomoea batatas]
MGFTVNTLRDMKKDEIDDMMTNLFHIFRWDLLVGERYGRKPLSGRSGVTSKWRISGGATSSPATAPTPWMLSIKKIELQTPPSPPLKKALHSIVEMTQP